MSPSCLNIPTASSELPLVNLAGPHRNLVNRATEMRTKALVLMSTIRCARLAPIARHRKKLGFREFRVAESEKENPDKCTPGVFRIASDPEFRMSDWSVQTAVHIVINMSKLILSKSRAYEKMEV